MTWDEQENSERFPSKGKLGKASAQCLCMTTVMSAGVEGTRTFLGNREGGDLHSIYSRKLRIRTTTYVNKHKKNKEINTRWKTLKPSPSARYVSHIRATKGNGISLTRTQFIHRKAKSINCTSWACICFTRGSVL